MNNMTKEYTIQWIDSNTTFFNMIISRLAFRRYILLITIVSSHVFPYTIKAQSSKNISWFKETYSIPDSIINGVVDYYITSKSSELRTPILFTLSSNGKIKVFNPKTNTIDLETLDTLYQPYRIVATNANQFVVEGKHGFNVYEEAKAKQYISKSFAPESVHIEERFPFEYNFKTKHLILRLLDFREKQKRNYTMDHNIVGIIDSMGTMHTIDYKVSKSYGDGKLVETEAYFTISKDNILHLSLSHSDTTIAVSLNQKMGIQYTHWGKHFMLSDFTQPKKTDPMGLYYNRVENAHSYSYGKTFSLIVGDGTAISTRFLFLPKYSLEQDLIDLVSHPIKLLATDSDGNSLDPLILPGNSYGNLDKWYSIEIGLCHLNFINAENTVGTKVYLDVLMPLYY